MAYYKIIAIFILFSISINTNFSAKNNNGDDATFKGNKIQQSPGPLKNFRTLYTRRFRGRPNAFYRKINNRIFIHTDKAYLYCISVNTGHILWYLKTRANLSATVYIKNNFIYATDIEKRIYKISIFSGRISWISKMDFYLHGCWGLYKNHVYCTAYNLNKDNIFTSGRIIRINITDGKKSSIHKNVLHPSAYGLSQANIMYVPGQNNVLFAYDLRDLRTRFVTETETGLITPPLIGEKSIFVLGRRKLYSIDKITGKIRWIRRINLLFFRDTIPLPRIYNNTVFLGLRGFDLKTGEGNFVIFGKGKKETDIYIAGKYLYYGGSLYYPDKRNKGFISVFNIDTREQVSFQKLNHVPKYGLTVHGNLLYYFDSKGILHCLTGSK